MISQSEHTIRGADRRVCYQVMETDGFDLFATWTGQWEDFVLFEIVPIFPPGEARAKAISSV